MNLDYFVSRVLPVLTFLAMVFLVIFNYLLLREYIKMVKLNVIATISNMSLQDQLYKSHIDILPGFLGAISRAFPKDKAEIIEWFNDDEHFVGKKEQYDYKHKKENQ